MSIASLVILSVCVFSGLIVSLVVILLFVQARIGLKGSARIFINDRHDALEVETGKPLLAALSEKGVFLASACGGKGTCGECRCIVTEGAGPLLPTETAVLSRVRQKQGYRLACQCRVRHDLRLTLPEAALDARLFDGQVVSNRNVSAWIKELVLKLPEGMGFRPGQYIQVHVPPYQTRWRDFEIDGPFRRDWENSRLRALITETDEEVMRAYSIANAPAQADQIVLNVRIALPPPRKMLCPPGVASSYLFSLKKGQRVRVSGPYGEFLIKDTDREMVYIGGGAGMAPLRSHLRHLFDTLRTQRRVSFWYGARARRDLFYDEEFRALEESFENFSFHPALSEPAPDDAWPGAAGFIHQVLYDDYLKQHEAPEEIEYYLCGPPMMIAAVRRLLDSLGVPEAMIAFDDFGESG